MCSSQYWPGSSFGELFHQMSQEPCLKYRSVCVNANFERSGRLTEEEFGTTVFREHPWSSALASSRIVAGIFVSSHTFQ